MVQTLTETESSKTRNLWPESAAMEATAAPDTQPT